MLVLWTYGHVLPGRTKSWRGVLGSAPTVESYPPCSLVKEALVLYGAADAKPNAWLMPIRRAVRRTMAVIWMDVT